MSQRFSGTKLEAIRGKKTQTDLANALRERGFGTTQTTISRWESGQVPHSRVLPALAETLGCRIEELFDEDDAEAAPMVPAAAEFLQALSPLAKLMAPLVAEEIAKAAA